MDSNLSRVWLKPALLALSKMVHFNFCECSRLVINILGISYFAWFLHGLCILFCIFYVVLPLIDPPGLLTWTFSWRSPRSTACRAWVKHENRQNNSSIKKHQETSIPSWSLFHVIFYTFDIFWCFVIDFMFCEWFDQRTLDLYTDSWAWGWTTSKVLRTLHIKSCQTRSLCRVVFSDLLQRFQAMLDAFLLCLGHVSLLTTVRLCVVSKFLRNMAQHICTKMCAWLHISYTSTLQTAWNAWLSCLIFYNLLFSSEIPTECYKLHSRWYSVPWHYYANPSETVSTLSTRSDPPRVDQLICCILSSKNWHEKSPSCVAQVGQVFCTFSLFCFFVFFSIRRRRSAIWNTCCRWKMVFEGFLLTSKQIWQLKQNMAKHQTFMNFQFMFFWMLYNVIDK